MRERDRFWSPLTRCGSKYILRCSFRYGVPGPFSFTSSMAGNIHPFGLVIRTCQWIWGKENCWGILCLIVLWLLISVARNLFSLTRIFLIHSSPRAAPAVIVCTFFTHVSSLPPVFCESSFWNHYQFHTNSSDSWFLPSLIQLGYTQLTARLVGVCQWFGWSFCCHSLRGIRTSFLREQSICGFIRMWVIVLMGV